MIYLAHTAHWQFLGLMFGILAWILTMGTAGFNEWRMWHVANVSVITSGVASVGIWRSCFYSHVLPNLENCHSMSITDTFVPVEILAAQVLIMLAVVCGLVANISAVVAMRMVYFSVEHRRNLRLFFVIAGALYLLSGTCTFVPLMWNVGAVLNNSTIDFPPEFYLPSAPVDQEVGLAVVVGTLASVLMFISGLVFLSYRYAWQDLSSVAPRQQRRGPWTVTGLKSGLSDGNRHGIDNPMFHEFEEIS